MPCLWLTSIHTDTRRLSTQRSAPAFYQFLGTHSLLIGLFPFFLPVYLWGNGFNLSELCVLIGLSGFSFCLMLGAWQNLSTQRPLAHLIAITFALEILLVLVVLLAGESKTWLVVLLGMTNGAYNAFFWTTQRTLFMQLLGTNNTGRHYGNFQIFVGIFLKSGILLGGLLLDAGGLPWLLMISALAGLGMSIWLWRKLPSTALHSDPAISLKASLLQPEHTGARSVFAIDGVMLFFESHFWTLSLFWLVKEDYSTLGMVVVILAVLFALIFYTLKNSIDQISGSAPYTLGVALYCASWLLRVFIDKELTYPWLLSLLLVITFCSSFFRLTFNKRFFNHARQNGEVRYLLFKSYVSQLSLGIFFLLLAGLLASVSVNAEQVLSASYLIAALLSVIYLRYR